MTINTKIVNFKMHLRNQENYLMKKIIKINIWWAFLLHSSSVILSFGKFFRGFCFILKDLVNFYSFTTVSIILFGKVQGVIFLCI